MNIAREAEAWIEDEIRKRRFGEDCSYAITLAQAMMPGGPVPAWMLLLTARNPIVTEGPLYHGPVLIGSPAPVEKTAREQVAEGIRQLRELASSKLAGSNGHSALAR